MAKLVDGRTVWYGRRVRGCRVSVVAAVLSLTLSLAPRLEAAEPPNDSAPDVVFAVDPRARDAQAMVDAVRAHLTGLPVRLVIDSDGNGGAPSDGNGGSHRILGTLTIEPTTPQEWVVSFTEPAVDTTLVRRIRVKPQGKGVALEEAAIVVRSMVEAILDGGHVGIARPPPRADESATRAPTATVRPPRRGIAASAAYSGMTFAPGLGWQSGGHLGARWQWGELYAGATYTIFPAIATSTSPATLRLFRHPGSIVGGYEGNARFAPIIEVEITADYVKRFTTNTEPGFEGTEASARWSFAIGAEGGVAWSVLPRLRLVGQAGLDWVVNPYSYVAGPTLVVATPSVRPKIALGLTLDLW